VGILFGCGIHQEPIFLAGAWRKEKADSSDFEEVRHDQKLKKISAVGDRLTAIEIKLNTWLNKRGPLGELQPHQISNGDKRISNEEENSF
jgi:hypothetical protein